MTNPTKKHYRVTLYPVDAYITELDGEDEHAVADRARELFHYCFPDAFDRMSAGITSIVVEEIQRWP